MSRKTGEHMKKIFGVDIRIWLIVLAVIVVVGTVVSTGFLVYFHGKADEIGSGIGGTTGKIVGTVYGSVDGFNEGIEAGAQAGLSAEETNAEVKSTIENVGNLQVLVAGVTLKNLHEIGDTYKSLSVISGEIVFTVDLSTIELRLNEDNNELFVLTASPVPTLYLDHGSTELLAETQKFSWSVNAEDGLQAYLNSMAKIEEQVEESVSNYDDLLNTAEQSAKRQIEQLIKSATGKDRTIIIEFNDSGEANGQ